MPTPRRARPGRGIDTRSANTGLDELEEGHDQPEMGNVIHVGTAVLFATRRIYAPAGLPHHLAVDNRERPTALVCITVASVET